MKKTFWMVIKEEIQAVTIIREIMHSQSGNVAMPPFSVLK